MSAGFLGGGFDLFLEGYSGKDAVFGQEGRGVFEMHGDNDSTVSEGRISFGQAHSIDDNLVVFRGRRNDESARTQAKRIDSAMFDFGRQFVAGRGQAFRSFSVFETVILQAVYPRLRMLDADAPSERLGQQGNPFAVQEPINVSCGMSGGQDDRGVGEHFVSVGGDNASHCALMQDQVRYFGLETHFAAGFQNALPNSLDHFGEEVGANARAGVHQNSLRRPVRCQRPINGRCRPSFFFDRV